MNESILSPLRRVDHFLRFELVKTLQRGGTLEPSKDWAVVSDCYQQLHRRLDELPRDIWKNVEDAFKDLTRDLNSIADLFRQLPEAKKQPEFNEQDYLQKVNDLINQARSDFGKRLHELESWVSSAPTLLRPGESNPAAVGGQLTLADKKVNWFKNQPVFVYPLLLLGLIVLLGSAADSIDKMAKFYKAYLQATSLSNVKAAPTVDSPTEGTTANAPVR